MIASVHDGIGFLSRRSLATIAIMLATIMQAIDTTIANVALPTIQGAMSASTDQTAWVLTSYIIASAIMTAPSSFLANRFGRRRLFVVSVIGFTLTSMLCGLATSINELVVYRIFQGVFGAALVPMSQAVLLDAYPKEKHGQAMAVWGMGIMIGPIIGPTLGGYITASLDWRWVFFINLPLGIVTLFGLLAFVDETAKNRALAFDWKGFLFLSIAVGALQLMLDRGQTLDWFDSTEIIIEALLVVLCFYLLVVHMSTSRNSFISTALFRDRNYATGLIIIFLLGVMLLATIALLPPYLEGLLGYPVDMVGEVMAPRGFGTMISMMVAGRLVNRFDARILVTIGLSFSSFSLWQMTGFNLDTSVGDIVYTGFMQGLGLGLIIVPLSTMTYTTLPDRLRNEGTALYSLMRNLGSSFGLSFVVAQLAINTQIHRSELVEHLNQQNLQTWVSATRDTWLGTQQQSLIALDGLVNQQANMLAFVDDFYLIMIASILMIPLLLIMRPPRHSSPVEVQG